MPSALSGYYLSPRLEVVERIGNRVAGARILDVGCAGGKMGAELKRRGAREVVGLEVVASAAAAARAELDAVVEVDLEQCSDLPFAPASFDLIIFADVLEHLKQPLAVLTHLKKYLHPLGRIICSVPNVRHESVVLSLLVDGVWDYQEAGILDRTHLKFFTLRSMVQLLHDAGLALDGEPQAIRSEPSPYLDDACRLVSKLGGDGARFRNEATAIQYLISATSRDLPRLAGKPHASNSGSASNDDGWQGTRKVRVLLAPELDNPSDCWAQALASFCSKFSGNEDVTVAIALPPATLAHPPADLLALGQSLPADIVLIEAPSNEEAWRRLLSGAAIYVSTSSRPALEALAKELKLEFFDGRQMC